MLFSSKINKFRTVALLLIFIGIGMMYLGLLFRDALIVFFILGMLGIFASVAIYFWVGLLSTQAAQVTCPQCGRTTKVLGKMDECMYCKATLSFDPSHAPKESDPNKR
ncbi:DUF2614 family zinc ribbon-containing protein [Marininema halotolerans]|uniref:Zinc-ribbon containing domain-containing protein n=1 Tax=Marininema halotolerans TaxID=1155944 RepID=A0A1I6UEH7_9BACL|nr:DUF2614 family zinc ribbon-containing protein [Marininema halotolerans]SFS99820.1 Zinc-ribbon containing domain-containing protein [Marininema halotolerans]